MLALNNRHWVQDAATRLIVPRKNVPQINTDMVAGNYFTALNSVVRDTNELVRQFLLPRIEELFHLRDMVQDGWTSDGILDELNTTVEELKKRVATSVQQRAASIALAVTLETSSVQRNQQQAQFEALGRPGFSESPFSIPGVIKHLIFPEVVCFCDIPFELVSDHVNQYGWFRELW